MRWLISALGYVFLTCASLAQVGQIPIYAPIVSGGSPPTWTNQTSGSNTSTCSFVTTCTITGLTVSSGFNVVAAGFSNQSGTSVTVSAVSLCGTSLTQAAAPATTTSGTVAIGLYYGTVTGGTCSAVITSSGSGAIANGAVSLGLLSNLSSTTPGTTCNRVVAAFTISPFPCSSGITVIAGGFGIAAIGYNNTTTMTAGNMTAVDSQSNVGTGGGVLSVGIAHFTTSITPQFAGANVTSAMIVAAPWD